MRQFFACKLAVLYLLLTSEFALAQCPGAVTCDAAPIECGVNGINGLSCTTSGVPTSSYSNLCIGAGVMTNLQWWAFVVEDGGFTMNIQYPSGSCPGSKGIMAGFIKDVCGGRGEDCTVDCDSRSISIINESWGCKPIYLWVQDCDNQACNFSVSVFRDTDGPTLPNPLPGIRTDGIYCIGRQNSLVTGSLPCEVKPVWSVDGVNYGQSQVLNYTFTEEKNYEVCYTATIVNNGIICDQRTHCQIMTPPVFKEFGHLRLLCQKEEPFNWHGLIIDKDCVNPPCTVRLDREDCLMDSIRPFLLLPIPNRTGSELRIPPSKQPFTWHNKPILFSCIDPPCTNRVTGPDGCLIDSIRPIRLLQFPPDHGFLKGNVYNDLNNNCQKDQGEPFLANIQIQIEGTQNTFQTLTNQNGFYSLEIPFDDYEIRALDLTDSLFSCPVPARIKVDRQDSTYCQDFFKFPAGCYPGRINILPLQDLGRMRCDRRKRKLTIEFYNTDKDELSAEKVILTVDQHMDLLNADLPFNQVSNQEIILDVPVLQSGEKIIAEITFRGDCGIQNENEEVCWTARYENGYMCNGQELMSEYCDIIVNSRDPNDLTISPFGKTSRRLIERTELTGTIRFHNDGTAPALDVYIDLNLPYDKLDVRTIRLLDASADDIDMTVMSDRIRFNMPDINLPNHAMDSIKSHGYVRYSIQVDPSVKDWEEIDQQADIYFDINAAVATNTEKQIISGDFIRNNIEATACVGDTFKGVLILGDTIFSDTLIGSGPDEINKYYVVSHPSYHIKKDTQMLGGFQLNGVRITKDTIIDFIYKTSLGCDSIVRWTVDAQTTRADDLEESVVLYPNPVTGEYVYIHCENILIQSIRLWHNSGSVSKTIPIENNRFSTKGLISGIYIYKWASIDGKRSYGTLIIQK